MQERMDSEEENYDEEAEIISVSDAQSKKIEQLVNRAKNNDQEAVEDLINMTQNKMFFRARSVLHTDDDAEEVVQQAYIKAFTNLHTMTDAKGFIPWLSVIVTNQAKDFMRSAENKYHLNFSELEGDEEDDEPFETADERIDTQPEMAYDVKQKKDIVQEILDALPDDQRVAVMMYFYDGMTTKEIAEQLGCKEVTVKARIRYAKEKIKDSVTAIQKRDGIKLYGLAPLPFFLYLLRGFGAMPSSATSLAGSAAAKTTAASQTHTAVTATTKAASTSAKGAASKFAGSAVGKLVLCGAVAAGAGAAYVVTKTLTSAKAVAAETVYVNAAQDKSIQLEPDNTYTWSSKDEKTHNGKYTIQKDTYSFADEDGRGCVFTASSNQMTVTSGGAANCYPGDVYTVKQENGKGAEAAEQLSNAEIEARFLQAGYEKVSYAAYDQSEEGTFFAFVKAGTNTAGVEIRTEDQTSTNDVIGTKGFAYGTLDCKIQYTEDLESAYVQCRYRFLLPDWEATTDNTGRVGLMDGGCGYLESFTQEDAVSYGKQKYQELEDILSEVGVTDEQLYQFAITYDLSSN
jgi:RNA polymerase sigma factor (sigma-70 family)